MGRALLVRWRCSEVEAESDEVADLMEAAVALRSCRQARLFETLGCRARLPQGCSSEQRRGGGAKAREGRASARRSSWQASEGEKAKRVSALPWRLAASGGVRTLGRSKALKSRARRLLRGVSERSDAEPGSA